jgi:hypothetical protein
MELSCCWECSLDAKLLIIVIHVTPVAHIHTCFELEYRSGREEENVWHHCDLERVFGHQATRKQFTLDPGPHECLPLLVRGIVPITTSCWLLLAIGLLHLFVHLLLHLPLHKLLLG